MTQSSGTWLFDTLEKCCEQHYSYSLSECVGSSGSGSNAGGSGKWYVDWSTYTSVLRIAVDSSLMSTARLICTPPKASAVRLMSLGTTRSVWGAGEAEAVLGSPTKELVIALIILMTNDNWWNEIKPPEFPASFLDSYCFDYCLQNLHPKIIGVTVDQRSARLIICWCSFTGVSVPSSISLTDYS
jgi:hypothetical protein